MPVGAVRPTTPVPMGRSQNSVQQLTWNGGTLLTNTSDAAYKRVVGQLLGLQLTPTQVPAWSELLVELRGLGRNGRQTLLVRAVLDWAVRRQLFLDWWIRDAALGGNLTGFSFAYPEMVGEMVATYEILAEWELLPGQKPSPLPKPVKANATGTKRGGRRGR